jgi:ML domain
MHTRYSILILLLCNLAACVKAEWRLCGGDQTFQLNVTEVDINPLPITAGSIVHFQIIGYQNEETYSGTLKASVKYLGFKVFQKTGNLCEDEGGPVNCPLLPGATSLDLQEQMPGFLPPGKMVLTLQASRNDSMPLFCVDIDLNNSGDKAENKKGNESSSLFAQLGLSVGAGSSVI